MLLTELMPTSFRVIDFPYGNEALLDSKEGLDLVSSLNLESCDDLGVPTLSAASRVLGESVLVLFVELSLRIGRVDVLVDRGVLLSLRSASELVLEVPALLLFGTSPRRNFSLEL